MLTKMDLENLREFRREKGRVLSVYLDIDQSRAANLNRGFEVALQSQLRSIEARLNNDVEQRDFAGCVDSVREIVRRHRPQSRTLVLLARPGGPVWLKELDVPVVTEARWGEGAYIQPLAEALDEFDTYAVVLVDKTRGRILTAALGCIHEQADIFSQAPVRHVKGVGMDHLRSQDHIHRKADEHTTQHLKRVVKMLQTVSRSHPFQRLVLSGTAEATGEFSRLLPKPLRAKLIAGLTLPITATAKEILDHTLVIEHDAERAFELGRTEALITAAAKGSKAVTGLKGTVEALNGKRVRELFYAENLRTDLVEEAIDAALAEGATIEQVRGEAAERLKSVGGIGAFLRF